jgi:glyceraldehyde-3-phosphate dehydrogenase/erythrose-4-phosphate dehydrogenase
MTGRVELTGDLYERIAAAVGPTTADDVMEVLNAAAELTPEPLTLLVDEAKISMFGNSRGGSRSVRVIARSYDTDDNQNGVELHYWAHPERGGVPRVSDKMRITIDLEDE